MCLLNLIRCHIYVLFISKYNNNFASVPALPIFSFWSTHYWFSQRFTWLYTFFFCSLLTFPKMLNVSQAASSPAVSLVYAVKNGSVFLNGTAASNLLCQLSAELVGYFLFYPPLIVAERKIQIPYFIKHYYLNEVILIGYVITNDIHLITNMSWSSLLCGSGSWE